MVQLTVRPSRTRSVGRRGRARRPRRGGADLGRPRRRTGIDIAVTILEAWRARHGVVRSAQGLRTTARTARSYVTDNSARLRALLANDQRRTEAQAIDDSLHA
jgi:hypothetical protein